MTKGSPIWAAYQNLLSKGRLKPNAEQAALATKLGQLQHQLSANVNRKDGQSRWWPQPDATDDDAGQSGIYIYGGVGTGKSRIADLFASTLPSLSSEVSYRRTHFFEFMNDIHMRLHRARSLSTYAGDPLVKIGHEVRQESSVLCLDEFQVSDIADAMILRRLFGSFWEQGGMLVSTSNRHPTDLYKNGLNRSLFLPFIADLQKRCVISEMKGGHDYRMDGKREEHRGDVFFVDEASWNKEVDAATQDHEFYQAEVPVIMGRKLMVSAAKARSPNADVSNTKPVVVTTFAALCETSTGAADYHALCEFASTIYISGLRRFASDELDIVRRFITLIDVAYESRTRVLCLSTDPILKTFENIILAGLPPDLSNNGQGSSPSSSQALQKLREVLQEQNLVVKGEGGSSSSMMSTFINNVEWSATGLKKASLATGGAGETDVRFAVGRAISRLSEMSSVSYGVMD